MFNLGKNFVKISIITVILSTATVVLLNIHLPQFLPSQYPSATIDGPTLVSLNSSAIYNVTVSDPQTKPPLLTVYYAPKISTGHQDGWIVISQANQLSKLNTYQTRFTFPYPGTFWVMVNINQSADIDRHACTGNPSYSPKELHRLSSNLSSCGPKSALEVIVTSPDSSTPIY